MRNGVTIALMLFPVLAWLDGVIDRLGTVAERIQKIVSVTNDLNTAITRLGASISTEIQAVTDALAASAAANNGAVSATDAQAAITRLNTLRESVDAETNTLTATGGPAPPDSGGPPTA